MSGSSSKTSFDPASAEAGAPPARVYVLGSGSLGVPLLETLHGASAIDLVGVGTQPDRPSGRHRHLHGTPLAEAAERLGLHPNKPDKVNDEEFLNHLRKLAPDLVVVVSFGQLLKRPLLTLPPFGCLNVHASLLPKYRGASPIQAAILAGDGETGVSFMRLDEGLDTGPVYRRLVVPLTGLETAESLECRLARLAAERIVELVSDIVSGELTATPQDDSQASFARKIKKTQGGVRWADAADSLSRQARAFIPWPHAHFFVAGRKGRKRIQITAAKAVASDAHGFAPGEVVQADKHGWTVACGRGFLHLFSVVPEGRSEMTSEEFLRGAPIAVGDILLDGGAE